MFFPLCVTDRRNGSGWLAWECLGIESADDYSAPVRPHLMPMSLTISFGAVCARRLGIKKRYLAMFATSQLTAAVVLQYEGYFLGCNRENVW